MLFNPCVRQQQCSMYTSHCSMHVGQLQLPIQHRVRAAALQVYAAVQQGQGSSRQPVPRQQGSSPGTKKRTSFTQKGAMGSSTGVQPSEGLAAAQHKSARAASRSNALHTTQQQQQQPQPDSVAQDFSAAVPVQQLQQQNLPEEGYVDEPWLQSGGYVPEPWEQELDSSDQWLPLGGALSTQQGNSRTAAAVAAEDDVADGDDVDKDAAAGDWWLTSSKAGEAAGVMQGYAAGVDAAAAHDGVEYDDDDDEDDDVVWLLEVDSHGEQDQQQDQKESGWLEGTSSSSNRRLTAAQRYALQQHSGHQRQQQADSHPDRTQYHPSNSSSTKLNPDVQATWDAAQSAAMSVLATYDVRYDVPRQPPFSSSSSRQARGPGGGGSAVSPEHISLTAAAAASAAKARHTRRQQAVLGSPVPYLAENTESHTATSSAAVANAHQQHQQQPHHPPPAAAAAAVPVLPDDPRWQSVQRSHAAYLSYMQQLSGMVISRQQQSYQVVYQVGICEHWLQLSHILTVFGGQDMSTAVTAAMWTRLAGLISRKVFTRMSHTERISYDMFIEQLVQQSIISISMHCSNDLTNTSGSTTACSPSQLAATAYALAVLGVSSTDLTTAVVQAAAISLSQAAAQAAAQAALQQEEQTGVKQVGTMSGNTQQQQQQLASAAAVCGWGPSEAASLMWGLGTLNSHPPDPVWLEDMTTVSGQLLSRCQPSQLWGVLWGFARLGHCPPDTWLARWLAAARQQLDAFDAEALSHSIWALAALQYMPDKLWLRAFCGMLAYKIRSLMAAHMSLVLPALSALGYKPRSELCRTIIAQVRRHMHTFKPSQLSGVLLALASYAPEAGTPASTSGWHPGRLLLFDFVSHSSPAAVMQAWSGDQAAQVLWALSRFRYVPDRAYLKALLSHLQSQLPTCSPDSLSMAVWGLAALKQPLPSRAWGSAWLAAAGSAAAAFSPPALAHGLSAMAALTMRPPPQLMKALTRIASGCLSRCSCMELGLLIAALADLHWRPSDAWMKAYVSQVSHQLPALENEDFGLLLYGLASLAQPLQPTLLARLCSEVKPKLHGLSGEGLGLLVWGIAQYDYEMREAHEWWLAVFSEFEAKWESSTLRGCALTVVGLAELGPRHPPPGTWEAGFITRYKALTPNKPTTWPQLVMGLRAAAGLEAGEQISISPWMNQLLLQLGRSWNLPDPAGAGGVSAINLQVSTAAAELAGVAHVAAEGASSAAVSLQLTGAQRAVAAKGEVGDDYDVEGFTEMAVPGDGVQTTSAIAVLL